jgi:hypothetical protein
MGGNGMLRWEAVRWESCRRPYSSTVCGIRSPYQRFIHVRAMSEATRKIASRREARKRGMIALVVISPIVPSLVRKCHVLWMLRCEMVSADSRLRSDYRPVGS